MGVGSGGGVGGEGGGAKMKRGTIKSHTRREYLIKTAIKEAQGRRD